MSSEIFEQLRALDDRDEPLALRFSSTNLLMWPFVRWLAVSAAQEKALDLQAAHAVAPRTSIAQRLQMLGRALLRGPMSVSRPFEIVMVGSSGGVVVQREGRWFDRINDYFTMEMPEQTLALDMALRGAYKAPRVPPHVRAFDAFDIQAGLRARLRRPSTADATNIERLVGFVQKQFPVELSCSVIEQIRSTLLHWAVRLPLLERSYKQFLERVRPRVIFLEGGSYGAFAHVCTWAAEAGIATAELQHGVISRAHLAYNYGDSARSGLATSLPRYLLLYGDSWRDEVRTPSELVTAGWPHLAENVGRFQPSSSARVLMISQGICTEQMVRLTQAMATTMPERRFVFRPHPGEVAFRERYRALGELPNVELSERGDIYDLMRSACVVVGHSSTALIEAACLGLPVLVSEDPASRAFLPAKLGTWFRGEDELISHVQAGAPRTPEAASFFAADWRERYREFIARVGVRR